MKKPLISVIYLAACLLLILSLACERESVPQANRQPVEGAPAVDIVASLSVSPSHSHIEEVAPKVGETKQLDPQALYLANCSACHQPTGQGIPGAFPPLAESVYVTSDNTERLAAIMIYGLMGPITVNGVQYNSAMAPLGMTLDDEQLAAVATYIRSNWGNSAPPVEPQIFTQVRDKYGARGPFTIQELGEEE